MSEILTTPDAYCDRCGEREETIEVTRCGDRERLWMLGHPCPCPGPRCPTCRARLTEERCPNTDCPIFGTVVPAPDIA